MMGRRPFNKDTDGPSLEAVVHSTLDFCGNIITEARNYLHDRGITFDDAAERAVCDAAMSYGQESKR
jgi:hypothetical protein